MTYAEKLKDPRWQKKRLEILERDDFRCVKCGTEEKTLHVHHGYYERNMNPWDYHESTLHTVCEDCHEITENIKRDLHYELGKISPLHLEQAMSYIQDCRSVILKHEEYFNSINEILPTR